MALTVLEANAVFRVLAWMCGTRPYAWGAPVTADEAAAALVTLAEAAGTRLQVSAGSEHIALAITRVGRALDRDDQQTRDEEQ